MTVLKGILHRIEPKDSISDRQTAVESRSALVEIQ